MSFLCGTCEVWLFHLTPGRIRQPHYMFGYCPPLLPPSGRYHPGHLADSCEILRRGTHSIEHIKPMPGVAFTHRIIPNGIRYSSTWCACGQVYLNVIKKKNPFPSRCSRYDWCVCATGLVKSNTLISTLTAFLARDKLICVSVITSHTAFENGKDIGLTLYIV